MGFDVVVQITKQLQQPPMIISRGASAPKQKQTRLPYGSLVCLFFMPFG